MPLRVASAMSLRNSSPDFGANNKASTAPMPAPTRKNVKRVEILSPESRSFPIETILSVMANLLSESPNSLFDLVRICDCRDYNKWPKRRQGYRLSGRFETDVKVWRKLDYSSARLSNFFSPQAPRPTMAHTTMPNIAKEANPAA